MTNSDTPASAAVQDAAFRRRNSLEWRLIAPVPLAIIAAIALAWIVVPRIIADNSTSAAIRASQQTAAQFKTIRAYYTENVVNKVVKSGAIKPGVDHKADDKTIPLPATMIHDLSALLSEKDTSVSLYSKYPFPNRKDRQLDSFQQQAWEFLNASPGATFSRNEVRNGKQIVRVAVADTMAVQACVTCHNTSATSPKTDWKVGDVRGVLEIASVIDSQLADGATLSNTIIIGAAAIGLVLLAISLYAARSVTTPLRAMIGVMRKIASGKLDEAVPELGRKDEIGQMAKTVLFFRDAAIEKIRLEGLSAEQRAQAEEEHRRNEDERRQHIEDQARAAEVQRQQTDEQRARNDEERRKSAEAQAKIAEEQARAVKALADGLAGLAQGDLTVRLDDGFTETYRQIKDDFNTMAGQLQETISAIAASAREVTSAAAEISTSTTDLSQRTEEQAAGLEQTSASMEEISATVRKNAENATHANKLTNGTSEVANRGGAVVAQAVDAMARIEDSSRKISDIIGVIDEIARQTNLLALNAAVEAARAGDAGRGFAVVASEVRSLAQRSSQAAKDIKDLITNSTSQVKDGVDLVNRTGASLGEIVTSIKEVAALIGDIATASAEQATGLDQVNKALTQMDEITQQNSALVEENAATAKTLEGQSAAMSERISYFRLEDMEAASRTGRRGRSAA